MESKNLFYQNHEMRKCNDRLETRFEYVKGKKYPFMVEEKNWTN